MARTRPRRSSCRCASRPTVADPLRVVLADDEPLGRLGLRQLIARHRDLAIVGGGGGGHDAVAMVEDTRPDLLLLDVQMPELDGFGVIAELAAPPPTIFVTAHDSFAVRAFERSEERRVGKEC